MKYISLFSGIGGFEQGIQSVFPDAECLGYSEIDLYAIKIYNRHFPEHKNLGDITKITQKDIESLERCDLVVGGFPCTNLSSMANFRGNKDGINGPKSGLFHELVRIMNYVIAKNPKALFIIENNNSMSKEQKKSITTILEENFGQIYNNVIDNALFGVQTRKRIIWTNFPFRVRDKIVCEQNWADVLETSDTIKYNLSEKMINCLNKLVQCKNSKGITKIIVKEGENYVYKYISTTTQKSRWDIQRRSDTGDPKSRPITSGSGGGNNIVIIREGTKLIPRKFTVKEIERLFGFTDGYTDVGLSDTRRIVALGNSIPVYIVKYVTEFM